MTSRKSWQEVYESENPFSLPRSIIRGLREFTEDPTQMPTQCHMRHLWVHTADGTPSGKQASLSVDDWLNLIDECSALGAESLVLSMGKGLAACPEAIAMAEWAQCPHEMVVGLHVYDKALGEEDVEALGTLKPEWTHIFAKSALLEKMRFLEEKGFNLHPAQAAETGTLEQACAWPEDMLCVCADGTMYACGLVAGNEEYSFGSFFDQRIDAVLADDARSRSIPEGHAKGNRTCHGCPALMEQVLHDQHPHNE